MKIVYILMVMGKNLKRDFDSISNNKMKEKTQMERRKSAKKKHFKVIAMFIIALKLKLSLS